MRLVTFVMFGIFLLPPAPSQAQRPGKGFILVLHSNGQTLEAYFDSLSVRFGVSEKFSFPVAFQDGLAKKTGVIAVDSLLFSDLADSVLVVRWNERSLETIEDKILNKNLLIYTKKRGTKDEYERFNVVGSIRMKEKDFKGKIKDDLDGDIRVERKKEKKDK